MSLRLIRTDDLDAVTFINAYQNGSTRTFLSADHTPIRYAILSHRWIGQEVTFQDCRDIEKVRGTSGWHKIQQFKMAAKRDGFDHAWMDTCCIDKSSSSELSEAINSMFEWYRLAAKCYAYLDDVDGHRIAPNTMSVYPEFKSSLWFTRGWTLQEMLAPRCLVFYSNTWEPIGDLSSMATLVADCTQVHHDLLTGKRELCSFSIAQKFSWAAGRVTTRPQDRAYSLLGIFGVHLTIDYGPNVDAFRLLQEELLRTTTDLTIFAWDLRPPAHRQSTEVIQDHSSAAGALLASSPDAFWNCGDLGAITSERKARPMQSRAGRVQFETYVLYDQSDSSLVAAMDHHAAVAFYEHKPTDILTLRLQPLEFSNDSTLVVREGSVRLCVEDIYLFAKRSVLRSVDVWLSSKSALENTNLVLQKTILCRCVPDLHDLGSQMEIVSGYPTDLWNNSTRMFTIPNSDVPDGEALCELRLSILVDRRFTADVHIFVRHDRLSLACFFKPPLWKGQRYWWMPYLSWRLLGWRLVAIDTQTHAKLLHMCTDVVTLRHPNLDDMTRQFILYAAIAPLFSWAMFLIQITTSLYTWVPAGIYFLVRYQAYDQQILLDPAWHKPLTHIFIMIYVPMFANALPAIIVCIFVMERLRIEIRDLRTPLNQWRILKQVHSVSLYSVGPATIPLVNISSIVFCTIYLTTAATHRSWYREDKMSIEVFAQVPRRGLTVIAVKAHIAMASLFLLIPLRYNDVLRILAALHLIVPLIWHGIQYFPTIAPWATYTCNSSDQRLHFYDLYAAALDRDAPSICSAFASEATALWILVGLSICEAIIACLTCWRPRPQPTPLGYILAAIKRLKTLMASPNTRTSRRPTPETHGYSLPQLVASQRQTARYTRLSD